MAETQYQHPHQPTLDTARLKLRPLGDSHLAMQLSLDFDPQVTRYLRPRPRTPEEIRLNLLEQKALALQHPGLGYWVAYLKNSNESIGWFLLQPPERPDQGPVEGQVDIGWRLLQSFWGQGYASEGAREMLRYCFGNLGMRRVFAETMAVNKGSRAVMSRIGLKFVRHFELEIDGQELVEGAEEGEVEYAITKTEWEELEAR